MARYSRMRVSDTGFLSWMNMIVSDRAVKLYQFFYQIIPHELPCTGLISNSLGLIK